MAPLPLVTETVQDARRLTLGHDGAELWDGAATASLPAMEAALSSCGSRAGSRLFGSPALRMLLGPSGPIGHLVCSVMKTPAQPVRAILFDKTARANWTLGWHQDRTICVSARHDVCGFGPWTVKDGLVHVAPPFDLLAGMMTVRIHLDPVDEDNAPLLIAPGSHRLGRVPVDGVAAAVAACGSAACTAAPGDVWAYATPILHASGAAARPRRRRVLQVDYAGADLPHPLEWAGI